LHFGGAPLCNTRPGAGVRIFPLRHLMGRLAHCARSDDPGVSLALDLVARRAG
jgi:hypothetical protein